MDETRSLLPVNSIFYRLFHRKDKNAADKSGIFRITYLHGQFVIVEEKLYSIKNRMPHSKKFSTVERLNKLLPAIQRARPCAEICRHCNYVNENEYSFCTNCGYPLHNDLLVDIYHQRVQQRTELMFKAETSVLVARIVLYAMASFLLLGIFFIFSAGTAKYFIVLFALILSGLFYFLAFWSRSNPFTAMLTAFILLVTFSAINIFGKLVQSFTTVEGLIGMLMCLALLFVILRGVQGAYRVTLMKEELETKL